MNYTERITAKQTLEGSFCSVKQGAILSIMMGALAAQPVHADTATQTWPNARIRWYDSSYSATQYEQAQKRTAISSLTDLYICKNYEEITSFVNKDVELYSFLNEIKNNILKFFPSHSLTLELMVDPEVEDVDQLVLNIRTDTSVDEAMDRLDQFDDEWWLDSMDKAHGKICINLEFS